MRKIGEVITVYRAMEQQLTASGSDRTAAVRRRNLTFLATERLLPQGAPIILALAAKVRNPPLLSIVTNGPERTFVMFAANGSFSN
jgi:hypothetical protein